VLLIAPGGLRCRMDKWSSLFVIPPRTWVDWTQALPAAGFTAIAMDQRNAGKFQAETGADHGWRTYAADDLALMDHLGFQRFHVLGGCIGGSFCLRAMEMAPRRVTAAVLQNPIGLHSEHPEYLPDSHAAWSREQREARRGMDNEAFEASGQDMWNRDFVFSVDHAFARTCPVPTMLLPGSDTPHPAATSAELAGLLPGMEVLADWRGPEHLVTQEARVVVFLQRHTPDRWQHRRPQPTLCPALSA
jgi:pimeloyl-ACP methyl ester carboxylesterase